MRKIPFNAIPIIHQGVEKDDSGKRVVVNSAGGALQNISGTILYGPHIYYYNAMTKKNPKEKKKNPKMVKKKFETCPLWHVLLDGYDLEIDFAEQELTII
jgi:hypothetical protein